MQDMPVFRGIPASIQLDGWWLDSSSGNGENGGAGSAASPGAPGKRHLGVRLAVLVTLADLLFWEHAPGISLPLFALAVLGAVAIAARPRPMVLHPTALLTAGSLPALDLVQPLSVVFLGAALALALVWLRHPAAGMGDLLRSTLAWLPRLPRFWTAGISAAARHVPQRTPVSGTGGAPLRRLVRGWAFPLGGALVLSALLIDANPVLARWMTPDVDPWQAVRRGLFWAGLVLMIAPLLAQEVPLRGAVGVRRPGLRLPGLGINAASVLRALVLFNLLLAVQMGTDASILIGGARLPEGLTLAEYAHRGAYPLLATALLAGAFALSARPFLDEHTLIRPLLMLWLAQNVVLCGAAARRLDLYVDSFGLTYLRLHAFVWMALVAAGLALIGWQVIARRDNRWLLLRGAGLTLGTLYLCAFVDFAGIIANHNMQREKVDLDYICGLGPMAGPALTAARQSRPELYARARRTGECQDLLHAPIRAWQEWGFRKGRVARYLAEAKTTEPRE